MKVALTVTLIFFNLGLCFGKQLHVGKSHSFQSIKAAVKAAMPHDTVYIHAGDYKENTIILDKPIKLVGLGNPVIDAEKLQKELLVIAADSVLVEGLVLTNVGVSYLNELSAIKVKNGKFGIIRNNEIRSCFFGIYLGYASDFTISNNKISGDAEEEGSAGNALHVWKAKRIEVAHNRVTGHRDGIYFEFVDHSNIHHNVSEDNIRYGLHFMFSNDDKYHQNVFKNNGAGVAVMFSRHITMTKNKFVNNWGGASYGLLLKEISDGSITENEFNKNTIGILAEGANRLLINKNEFVLNGTALDIKGNCLDNTIIKNNFIANTFEVVTNTNQNKNSYDLNYWSNYKGYDLNRDGIGEEPYRPVSLYAKITSEIPAASLLLHSFVVGLIDFTESVIPQIIPAELIDKHPKMEPFDYD